MRLEKFREVCTETNFKKADTSISHLQAYITKIIFAAKNYADVLKDNHSMEQQK